MTNYLCLLGLFGSLLLAVACANPAAINQTNEINEINETNDTEDAMAPQTNFDIRYDASGGRPPITANLQISESGQAELYLGSSWSLPSGTDTVGFFAGQLSAAQLEALNKHLSENEFLNKPTGPEPASPDANTRYLSLTNGQQENQLILTNTADDPSLATLEEMLAEIMNDLIKRPQKAVQVSVTTTEAGDQAIQPTVSLTNVGIEPLPILLFEEDSPNNFLRISLQLEQWNTSAGGTLITPLRTFNLTRDDVAAFVNEGLLPAGIQELAAGDSYTFELSPIDLPSKDNLHLSGGFTFWLPGSGPERRSVTVQSEAINLDKDQ